MGRMGKRLLAVSLSLVMAAGVLPGTAGAVPIHSTIPPDNGIPEEATTAFNYRTKPDKNGTIWLLTEKVVERGDLDVFVQDGTFQIENFTHDVFLSFFDPSGEYVYTYDNSGNLLTESYPTTYDGFMTQYVYTPNNSGTLAKMTGTLRQYGSDVSTEDTYSYDNNNSLIKVQHDESSSGYTFSAITTFTYDGNGRLSSVSGYTENSSTPEYTITYFYNEDGSYSSKFVSSSTTSESSYDKYGNIINPTYSYSYDSEGHLLQVIRNGSLYASFAYDKAGNKSTEYIDYSDSWDCTFTYSYDKYNNPTKIDVVGKDKSDKSESKISISLKYVPYSPPQTGTLGQSDEISWTFAPDTNTLTLTGDSVSDTAPVIAAGYKASGQMLFATRITAPGITKLPKDADHIKLFWLDQNGRPKCDCATIK